MDTPTLTPRQKEVYDYIRSYIQNNQRAPYIREIQEVCRASSHKAVIDKLLALERKGYIKRELNFLVKNEYNSQKKGSFSLFDQENAITYAEQFAILE